MRNIKLYLTELTSKVRQLIVFPWHKGKKLGDYFDKSGNLQVKAFRILILIPIISIIGAQYHLLFNSNNIKSFTPVRLSSITSKNLGTNGTIFINNIDTSIIKINIVSDSTGSNFLRLLMKPGGILSKEIIMPVDDSIPINASLKIRCRSFGQKTICRVSIIDCLPGELSQEGGEYNLNVTIQSNNWAEISFPLNLLKKIVCDRTRNNYVKYFRSGIIQKVKITFYPESNSTIDIGDIRFEWSVNNLSGIILLSIIIIIGVVILFRTSLANFLFSKGLNFSSTAITSRVVFFLVSLSAFRLVITNSFPLHNHEAYLIYVLFLLFICVDEFYPGNKTEKTIWSLRYFILIIAVWLSKFTDNAFILSPLTLAVFIPVIQQRRRLLLLFTGIGILIIFIVINNFNYFIPGVTGTLIITGTFVIAMVIKEILIYELIKSEANYEKFLYKNLFDNSYDGIYTTNEHGIILTANYGFGNMLGYTIEETLGKTIFKFVIKEDHPLLERLMDDAVSKQLNMCDINFLDINKCVHTALIRTVAIYKDNLLIGYQSIATDITERKHYEHELRNSQSRYKTLLNAIPDKVLKFTREGILVDYYNQDNPESKINFEKLLGNSINNIFEQKIAQDFLVHAENAFKRRQPQIFEYESRINRDLIYDEARIVPVQNENFIAIIRDITERRQAEFKIQQYLNELDNNRITLENNANELAELNLKLEETNKNKDKFFSIVAHDLRSPFTGLLGFSEILSTEIETLTTDQIKNYVDYLSQSLKNVFRLLENLLDWSRVQTGQIKFVPENFNLEELVKRIVGIFQINASEKKINIEICVLSGLKVFADEDMVDITIRNLLSNAIKFTRPGGNIGIQTFQNDGMIEITISDNGIGIQPENLEKLFRINENISTQGTAKEKGTGLGLLLCKEFIEKNGGNIEVESIINKGSIFKFTLPVSR